MPWSKFAQQWGGANINVHRQDVIDTIEAERVGFDVDDDATTYKTNSIKRNKDGNFVHGQTMRLGSKWGVTQDPDDGKWYEVKETDTFTWKEVPEAPEPGDGDASTLVADSGGDDDDDDGSSMTTTVPASIRSVASSSYAPSSASSPVHEFLLDEEGDIQGDYDDEAVVPVVPRGPKLKPRRAGPVAPRAGLSRRELAERTRRPNSTARTPVKVRARTPISRVTQFKRQARQPYPRAHRDPRRYDIAGRHYDVITPPASSDEDDEPAPVRSPPRRARAFRDASPGPPRRSTRARVPRGFYDPVLGKGWKGYTTSSDGAYVY